MKAPTDIDAAFDYLDGTLGITKSGSVVVVCGESAVEVLLGPAVMRQFASMLQSAATAIEKGEPRPVRLHLNAKVPR